MYIVNVFFITKYLQIIKQYFAIHFIYVRKTDICIKKQRSFASLEGIWTLNRINHTSPLIKQKGKYTYNQSSAHGFVRLIFNFISKRNVNYARLYIARHPINCVDMYE